MSDRREHLFLVFHNLTKLKSECSCGILSECCLSDITLKQIHYLKMIDQHGEVTFSRLAEITENSKPTITDMINKLVRMDCVYREQCPHDGRIHYIRLTGKGEMIARAEEMALQRVIKRLEQSLNEDELDLLIEILRKVI